MEVVEMVTQLAHELGVPLPLKKHEQTIFLPVGSRITIAFRALDPGYCMHSDIVESPKVKREELFIHLMNANFLGQGTGGARLGIDANEKFLTLSLGFPYELNYPLFRESVEDFVNYWTYWREEIAKITKEI